LGKSAPRGVVARVNGVPERRGRGCSVYRLLLVVRRAVGWMQGGCGVHGGVELDELFADDAAGA